MTACSPPSDEALKKHMPGTYELYVGSEYDHSRLDFSESSLVIERDGTFEQSCVYKSPQESLHSNGAWKVIDGDVYFDKLMDCAGVHPSDSKGQPATVGGPIVEGLQKPQILLDPDINIFYRRVED